VADPDTLVEGLASAIAVAASRIDLTRHEGVHPRVGSADVVPFVRFRPDDARPELAARALARRIAMLGVPAIGYGELGGGLRPAAFRNGGPERLAERMAAGEVVALAGPDRPHPTAGVVLLGVRAPLVAFNVDLDSQDVSVARGVGVKGSELVGLMPARVAAAAAGTALRLSGFGADRLLEVASGGEFGEG
jgi:glutamate formiminotransferase